MKTKLLITTSLAFFGLNGSGAMASCMKPSELDGKKCSVQTCHEHIFNGDNWWGELCSDAGSTCPRLYKVYGPYQENAHTCFCPCTFEYLGPSNQLDGEGN